MSKEKEMRFTMTGTVKVAGEPEEDYWENICGFKLKDGRIVRPVLALELEDEDGNQEYMCSDTEMKEIGFEVIEYDETHFS